MIIVEKKYLKKIPKKVPKRKKNPNKLCESISLVPNSLTTNNIYETNDINKIHISISTIYISLSKCTSCSIVSTISITLK